MHSYEMISLTFPDAILKNGNIDVKRSPQSKFRQAIMEIICAKFSKIFVYAEIMIPCAAISFSFNFLDD